MRIVSTYMRIGRRWRALMGFVIVVSAAGVAHPASSIASPKVPEVAQIEDPRGDAHEFGGAVRSEATYIPEADILKVWFENGPAALSAHMLVAATPASDESRTYVVRAEPPQRGLRTSPGHCFQFNAKFGSEDAAPRAGFMDRCNGVESRTTTVEVSALADGSAIVSWKVPRRWTKTFSDCSYLLHPTAAVRQATPVFSDVVDEAGPGSRYRIRRFPDALMPTVAVGTGGLSRVNTSPGDQQANGGTKDVSVSRTGRFVAFESSASNLTSRCTPHDYTIFVKDLKTGRTDRLDLGDDETAYREDIFDPQISTDGSRVVYAEGDYYDGPDSFWLWDRTSQVRRQVEAPRGYGVADPFPVGDGRFIGFTQSSNSKPYAKAMLWDTHLDRYIDLHSILSLSSRGSSILEDASEDGSVVLLRARARERRGPSGSALYLVNRHSGQVRRVGIDTSQYGPTQVTLSGNGRFVLFITKSNRWTADDRDEEWDVFLHDAHSHRTTLLSEAADGSHIREAVYIENAGLSYTGRYAVFSSTSDELAGAAKGSRESVYVYDRRDNTFRVANSRIGSSEPAGYIWDVAVAAVGGGVFFTSYDSYLVEGDTNAEGDVFRYLIP